MEGLSVTVSFYVLDEIFLGSGFYEVADHFSRIFVFFYLGFKDFFYFEFVGLAFFVLCEGYLRG